MRVLDSGVRAWILAQGTGVRWLREELAAAAVRTPLSEGCLAELVRESDRGAWSECQAAQLGKSYLGLLRLELQRRAAWVQRWTESDEPMDTADESAESFVRIARNFALPRRWRVPEPVAVAVRRQRAQHWSWTGSAPAGAASGVV